MNDKLIAALLRVALEDLEGARALAAIGNRNAFVLLEQAAEKVIRAVLTSENIHAGRSHDLDAMVAQVPDANPLKPALVAVEHLARYATAFRYPTPGGRILAAPTDFEAQAARVDHLLTEARRRFGVDLTQPQTPAAQGPRPGDG